MLSEGKYLTYAEIISCLFCVHSHKRARWWTSPMSESSLLPWRRAQRRLQNDFCSRLIAMNCFTQSSSISIFIWASRRNAGNKPHSDISWHLCKFALSMRSPTEIGFSPLMNAHIDCAAMSRQISFVEDHLISVFTSSSDKIRLCRWLYAKAIISAYGKLYTLPILWHSASAFFETAVSYFGPRYLGILWCLHYGHSRLRITGPWFSTRLALLVGRRKRMAVLSPWYARCVELWPCVPVFRRSGAWNIPLHAEIPVLSGKCQVRPIYLRSKFLQNVARHTSTNSLSIGPGSHAHVL